MEHKERYPSDVGDDEWAFVAPYLTLMTEEAPQREHSLREVFNGLRWMIRTGAQWRMMPHDLPPWYTVYQQSHRWLKAGVFEAIVHDLRNCLKSRFSRSVDRISRPKQNGKHHLDGSFHKILGCFDRSITTLMDFSDSFLGSSS